MKNLFTKGLLALLVAALILISMAIAEEEVTVEEISSEPEAAFAEPSPESEALPEETEEPDFEIAAETVDEAVDAQAFLDLGDEFELTAPGLSIEEADAQAWEFAEESGEGVEINDTNFPDDNFRAYVSSEFDWDGDGFLSNSEIKSAYSIYVVDLNIQKLDGIEYFYNVDWLQCSNNALTELDVSNLKRLRRFDFSGNPLTTLNASGCTSLTYLGWMIPISSLTYLNVSGCTSLTSLTIYNGGLTTMDLTDCTSLTSLKCSGNQFTSLDLTDCTSLSTLDCSGCKLTSLNVAGCSELTELRCGNNHLTTLNLDGCSKLSELYCSDNQLSSLNLNGCTNLTRLDCYNNQFETLDVSGCTSLTRLDCTNNQLKTLDVSGCTNLSLLYCPNNQLISLDVSQCGNLNVLDCYDNKLTNLNVKGCAKLNFLSCYNNQLTTLDVTGNENLKDLACYKNKLTSLTVGAKMEYLFCSNNQLTKLDVSKCPDLHYLTCYGNSIATLDVRNCPKIMSILNDDYRVETTTSVIYADRDWKFGLGEPSGYDYGMDLYADGVRFRFDKATTVPGLVTASTTTSATPAAVAAPAPAPAAPTAPAIPTIAAVKKSSKTTITAAPGSIYQLDLGGVVGKKFKSSKKVATVDANGLVTIKKAGKTKITFKVGKKTRAVTLTVKDPTVPTFIALNLAGTIPAQVGVPQVLTVTLPEGTTSGVKWKSSNKKVASVSNGVVTFKKAGKVTITATATRGKKKAKVKFVVTK